MTMQSIILSGDTYERFRHIHQKYFPEYRLVGEVANSD